LLTGLLNEFVQDSAGELLHSAANASSVMVLMSSFRCVSVCHNLWHPSTSFHTVAACSCWGLCIFLWTFTDYHQGHILVWGGLTGSTPPPEMLGIFFRLSNEEKQLLLLPCNSASADAVGRRYLLLLDI